MLFTFNTPLIKKFESLNLTGLSLSIACFFIFTHYFLTTPEPLVFLSELPHHVFWYGIGVGIFATVLPTILLILSIERLGASQFSIISSIGPIIMIFLAILFLDEHLNSIQWIGCILNIAGVIMITFPKTDYAFNKNLLITKTHWYMKNHHVNRTSQ